MNGKTLLLATVLAVLLSSCKTAQTQWNDFALAPDYCDPRGECNVGKRPR